MQMLKTIIACGMCFIGGIGTGIFINIERSNDFQNTLDSVAAGKAGEKEIQSSTSPYAGAKSTPNVNRNIELRINSDALDVAWELERLQENQGLLLSRDGSAKVIALDAKKHGDRKKSSAETTVENKIPDIDVSASSVYTKADIKQMVPDEYVDIFACPEGRQVDDRLRAVYEQRQAQLQAFDSQTADSQWGYTAQRQLENFFYTHDFAHYIQIDALECRESMCRLLGQEHRAGVSFVIRRELFEQPWFKELFTPRTSLTTSGSQKKPLFYQVFYKK